VPSGYESPHVPLLRFTSPEEGYRMERDVEVAPASVHGEGATELPKFDYHLDESDPDVAVLRRQDGSFVAAFSAQGATREGILEATKEDYAKLVEAFLERRDFQEIDAQPRKRTS
jgi:hypothetical protein